MSFFFFVAPVFHPHVTCPSPRQTPQRRGSLLGAVSAAYWRTSASGTSSAAGSGGIVQTPKTALQAARWTATANAPHQRRAHPWAAAPRSVAGARRARSAMRRCTRRWDSSFQRPPISAARTHKRRGPPRVSSGYRASLRRCATASATPWGLPSRRMGDTRVASQHIASPRAAAP